MFRGLFLLAVSTTLKSRLMYLYGVALVAWMGALYVISSSAIQINSTPNVPLDGISAFTGLPSLGAVLIFLSVFGASRKIPEMIKPTLAGFYLSKPLSRVRLLSYTLLSMTIVFSLMIAVILGIYGAYLGQLFPAHASALEIVGHISLEVFVFVVYVPFIALLGLTTRSGSFAFLLTFAIWLVAKILALEEMRGLLLLVDNSLISNLADFVYYILPRSSDISALVSVGKRIGQDAIDWSPLWTSTLSALGVYALATLRFRRMDL